MPHRVRPPGSSPADRASRACPSAGSSLLAAALAVVLLLALAAPGIPAEAQPTGDSPRLQRVRGLVEAFNSGEPETLLAYLRDHATPEWLSRRPEGERLRLFGRLMEDLGRVEIDGLRFDGQATVTVGLAAERRDAPVAFELVFEAHAPHRIEGLGIEIGASARGLPEDLPPPPELADLGESARAALERYFEELAAADRFAGAVLLALDGEAVFEGAYGPADRSWDVPNRMSTRFDVGSINKDFTKVAVGRLLAEGQLALDDTILDVLPDYPNPDAGRRITVRHLLEHTSGLGDLVGPEFFRANKALFRSNRDYFPLFAEKPLAFEPGTDRRYSNAGYIVLGAIVAEVSGVSYAEYVERHVFEPAGMAGAAFAARDRIHREVAVGYTRQPVEPPVDGRDAGPEARRAGHAHRVAREAPLRPNTFMLPVVGMGAGSAVATAADLLAFDRALREHRLLEPRWTEWFFTGELPEEEPAGRPDAVDHPIGVAGGAPGVCALLEGDGAHTVVVLSNLDPPTAEALGLELSRRLRELAEPRSARRPQTE